MIGVIVLQLNHALHSKDLIPKGEFTVKTDPYPTARETSPGSW